jgi:RND family efflux transporter MFP subunit
MIRTQSWRSGDAGKIVLRSRKFRQRMMFVYNFVVKREAKKGTEMTSNRMPHDEQVFDVASSINVAQVRLARNGGIESRRNLAQDSGVTPEAQLLLAKDPDIRTRCHLAENPSLTPEAQTLLAKSGGIVVRALAENSGLTLNMQVLLVKHVDAAVRQSLAKNPGLSSDLQAFLARNGDGRMRWSLARNPSLAPGLQMLLTQDHFSIRGSLARNPGLTPQVQAILAQDEKEKVRQSLARNPGLTPEAQAILARDKNVVCGGKHKKTPLMNRHRAAGLLLGTVFAVTLLLVFLRDTQRPAGAVAVLADEATGSTSAEIMPSTAMPSAGTARTARSSLTVRAETPRSGMLPVRVTANGSIAAWQEAVISSDMPDLRLIEVRVDVGDMVDTQEVLAVFDDETVKVAVAQAEASLAEAQALAVEARENATRARSLETSGALSQQAILQYLTAAQSANARVKAAQARLVAERLRLERTRVRAPDRGIISSRNATVGAVSGLGGELFRMVRQGRIEWRAELLSSELERVSVGTPVTLTLPGGQAITGKVRALAPTVNPASRAGLVYVDLPEESPARPGMFARGVFELGGSVGLTVPQRAVVMREAFNYVFILDAERRVHQVKVTTGRRVGDRVEIIDGLDENAAVVVAGAGFLNDGDIVRAAPADMPAQKTAEPS